MEGGNVFLWGGGGGTRLRAFQRNVRLDPRRDRLPPDDTTPTQTPERRTPKHRGQNLFEGTCH